MRGGGRGRGCLQGDGEDAGDGYGPANRARVRGRLHGDRRGAVTGTFWAPGSGSGSCPRSRSRSVSRSVLVSGQGGGGWRRPTAVPVWLSPEGRMLSARCRVRLARVVLRPRPSPAATSR